MSASKRSYDEHGSNDDNGTNENDDNGNNNNLDRRCRPRTSRRDAIQRGVLVSTTTSLLAATMNPLSALSLTNPLTLLSGNKTPLPTGSDGSVFRPAKRATAYLVDSTIPPTLVPFRASREAAVLKALGNGGGTIKTAFIEEEITTNNVMNKAVFGTATLIQDGLASLGVEVDAPPLENPAKQPVDALTGKAPDGEEAPTQKIRKRRNESYDSTYVFLGLDYEDTTGEDATLALGIMDIILKPRRSLATSLALEFAPLSTQPAFDAYLTTPQSTPTSEALLTLLRTLTKAGVPTNTLDLHRPILEWARDKRLPLIAVAPEMADVTVVRNTGLQNLDPIRRDQYVADSTGFIEWTQDPKNKLYTERSLLKDFRPIQAEAPKNTGTDTPEDTVGGYFAERILVHETIATAIARYTLTGTTDSSPTDPARRGKNSLVITLAPQRDLRYLGGPNGRLPRVLQKLDPRSNVDEEAVTTILINPSAESTLSKSRFLRLEIGTAPRNLKYQTKVADYLWFSRMPKVNMLPRMMNGF